MRVVLVGCKSSGKNSAGKAILGSVEFGTAPESAKCIKSEGDVMGRRVSLVKCPGWFVDSSLERSVEQAESMTVFSLLQCSPGPHALLLAVRVDMAFTNAHLKAIHQHLEPLSESAWRHTLVLFTRAECLGDACVEQFIESEGKALKWLVEKCGNRYHALKTYSYKDGHQVAMLLDKIEQMVAENSGCYFDTEQNVTVKDFQWNLQGRDPLIKEKKGVIQRFRKQQEETDMVKSMDTPPQSEYYGDYKCIIYLKLSKLNPVLWLGNDH